MYEVMGANGKLRPTTLRDARKMDLIPSVTTIINCAAKHKLINWKIEQHIATAAKLVRREIDSIESYIQRIKEETKNRLDKAPDTGSAIHGAIERCLAGESYNYKTHVDAALKSLRDWCEGPYESEKSFAHPLGYGGKVDVHKRTFLDALKTQLLGHVVDFKTKEFSTSNLPKTWPDHSMQLAAYRMGLLMPDARCAIIFVSTSMPGLTHLVEVANDELERGWRMFQALLTYWQEDKQYQTAET